MYCDTCNKESSNLIKHHWRTDDGIWHDNYICKSCNRLLIPTNFGMKSSHCLPPLETQRDFISLHNKESCYRKNTYRAITVYKDDYDRLIKHKPRGFFIYGVFHEMVDKYIKDHAPPVKVE